MAVGLRSDSGRRCTLDGLGVLTGPASLATQSLPRGRDPEPVEGLVERRNPRSPPLRAGFGGRVVRNEKIENAL